MSLLLQAAREIPWYVSLAHKVVNPGYSIAMVDKLWWQGDLQGCFANDPQKAKQLFEQHNKEVREVRRLVIGHMMLVQCPI